MCTTELIERFESARPRLRALAYRMLGSLDDADDAVQETWTRLRGSRGTIDNTGAWLTTVTARVCLNMLRARHNRREEIGDDHFPDPVVAGPTDADPEVNVLLADAVGLALLVVLGTLSPEERLAFVLYDIFAVPFDEIAPIVDRSPDAARKLASRARRRIQRSRVQPDGDRAMQRRVVDAFFSAARAGDFESLLRLLHPDAVLRADIGGAGIQTIRGAPGVAAQAELYSSPSRVVHSATVNGTPGAVVVTHQRTTAVIAFVVSDGSIVAIDILADPARLATLDLSAVFG